MWWLRSGGEARLSARSPGAVSESALGNGGGRAAILTGGVVLPGRRVDRDQRFEAEMLPHLRSLFGAAYRMTGNAHDAEDLVQETFLRAHRALDRFEAGTNARAWLHTILQRVRTDAFRRRRRRPRRSSSTGEGPRESGRRRTRSPRATRTWSGRSRRCPRTSGRPWCCATSRS